ncbi:hypothetical protein Patl1_20693 [Pistacia atlantica]|jgi:hypothetical protein
MDIH